MKVMTLQSYIVVTIMYGICVVLVVSWVYHYFLFVAALSVTTLLLYVVVLAISGEQ